MVPPVFWNVAEMLVLPVALIVVGVTLPVLL
jgi:hypothetical protein